MIHIKKLFRLQTISHLRLIAGQDGLERTVTSAVLFEYDPSRMQLLDFYRGDLVVTTLAYARGDADLVERSLVALMNQGIAGLLVKTAYFDELPQSVIQMADRLGTPIFLFDDTYIEEVILQVTDLIRGRRRFAGYEKDLDDLMEGKLTEEQVRQKVELIDPIGLKSYRVAAILPKERIPRLEERIFDQLEKDAQAEGRYIFMEWHQMTLAICRQEEAEERDTLKAFSDFLKQAGIDCAVLSIGISRLWDDSKQMGIALREAVYAARKAKMLGMESVEDLGIYAYLFPMSKDVFICDQCRRGYNDILLYDKQNHTNLVQTAQAYVDANMDIAAAAKALYQHPNTVRYRLNKIQKILHKENDPLFEAMLCMVVGVCRILEEI